MKKYTAEVSRMVVEYGELEVDAENEIEARDKVSDLLHSGAGAMWEGAETIELQVERVTGEDDED